MYLWNISYMNQNLKNLGNLLIKYSFSIFNRFLDYEIKSRISQTLFRTQTKKKKRKALNIPDFFFFAINEY